jgi:hypothetical protein
MEDDREMRVDEPAIAETNGDRRELILLERHEELHN